MNIHSHSDFAWPAAPLLPGKWRDLTEREVMRLMIRLCADNAAARALCTDHDILAVRMRPLIAIRDGLLIEFLARPPDGERPATGAFVYRPGLFDLLTGASRALHTINEEGDVLLDSAERALEYAQLFCAAMNGEDGIFMPLQSEMQIDIAEGHPERDAALEEARALPKVEADHADDASADAVPDRWRIDLSIAYGTQVFRSLLTVSRSGMIDMVGDRHLCGMMRPVSEKWVGHLRRQLDNVAVDGPSYPCRLCSDDAEDAEKDESRKDESGEQQEGGDEKPED